VFEVFKFDFQEEYDGLRWLALSQLVQSLEQQKECLDLQESLNALDLL